MSSLRTDLVVSALLNLSDLEWDVFRRLEAVYDTLCIDTTDPERVLFELKRDLPEELWRRLDTLAEGLLLDKDPSIETLIRRLENRLYDERCYTSVRRPAEDKDSDLLKVFRKRVLDRHRWFLLITVLDPAL